MEGICKAKLYNLPHGSERGWWEGLGEGKVQRRGGVNSMGIGTKGGREVTDQTVS